MISVLFFLAGGALIVPLSQAQVGSIQGSFNVSTSGSSSYSLPIRTVPGSSGMAPKLTLSYDSQSVGGAVGAGWGVVGISTITRGARNLHPHGRITGVKLDDDDALFLDGQELVPVSRNGVGPGQRIEYRKRVDDQSRITRTGASFGTALFQVDTKGGLQLVFDGSNNSRVQVGTATLLAAVSSIRDTVGNFISFEYAQNGKGDFNVVAVKYTGHRNANGIDRPPFAAVTFEYETAPRPSTNFLAGFLVSRDQRLKSITSGLLAGPSGQTQLARYSFEYKDTETLGRFVLSRIREFGSDNSELLPTEFEYTNGSVSWTPATAQLPIISLAAGEALSLGYRVANYTSGDTRPDLLFALEVEGQIETFAFANENGAWVPDEKFKPPFAFATADGADLGTLLADLNGDGRVDLIKRTRRSDGAREEAALLAGPNGWEVADAYKLPFDLSDSGKPTAIVSLVHISGGVGHDLVYEADGQKGVLINTGSGWQAQPAPAPPAPLQSGRFIDLDCDGREDFLATVTSGGGEVWQAWRFVAGSWQPMATAFLPTNASARGIASLQKAKLNGDDCTDLIFAGVAKSAWLGGANGLTEVAAFAPVFSIVNGDGGTRAAIVADFDGNGLSDVVVNQRDVNGGVTSFAYLLKSDGWHLTPGFVPPLLSDLGQKSRILPVLADVDGNGMPDIVLPSDSRDSFGKVYLSETDGLHESPNYVPKVAFSRKDQQDRGIRFLDLNGDGLLDVIYRRDVTRNGKLDSISDAQMNTGTGWRSVAGLRPPLPFAGDGISGSPSQFVDVNGDGQLDLLYSYDKADGTKLRKLYLNTNSPGGTAAWIEAVNSALAPPNDFPFAIEHQGDQGVRLTDLNGDGRADLIIGSLPAKAAGETRPIENCKNNPNDPVECDWNRDLFRAAAFLNNGTGWAAAPTFASPIPLVALGSLFARQSSDLSVQIADLTGDRLPDIAASFQHPFDKTKLVNEVWENTGSGWRKSAITVPTMLDEPSRSPRVLVQWIDMNGDGLSDLVKSERRGNANKSTTWLSTGNGFQAAEEFRIPIDAIADRDGDPVFRLVDANGDGLPDVISAKPGSDGLPERKLWLNNGATLSAAPDDSVRALPAVIDGDGRDQGVRFFDVNADGLLDVLQSYATGPSNEVAAAQILLNAGGRSDMLAQFTGGYGLRTEITYQPMGQPLKAMSRGIGWAKVYEPGENSVVYPLIRPVPAAYLVSRVRVSDVAGGVLGFSYRYGSLLFDAREMKSLGFGWREAFNEKTSVVERTEVNQSLELVGRPARTTSCLLNTSIVQNTAGRPNLCAMTGNDARARLLRAVEFAWRVASGMVGPASAEQTPLTQITLKSSDTREWELDGGLVSKEVTTLKYLGENSPDILGQFGNVEQSTTVTLDGSVTTVDNVYSDDVGKWFLGRLTQSTITKSSTEGGISKTDRRVVGFSYDPATGLLASEIADLANPEAIKKRYDRDSSGNIIRATSSASLVVSRINETEYDSMGRFSTVERLTGGELSFETAIERDPRTGAPVLQVAQDGATTTMAYDGFGRLRESTSPTGVITKTYALRIADLADPNLAKGLPAAYAVMTQIGSLPATFVVLDARDRVLRNVVHGFELSGVGKRRIYADVEYDVLGRITRRSRPYDRGQPPQWLTATYDALGRPITTTAPDGAASVRSYASRPGGGRVLGLRDPLGRRAAVESDARGLTRMSTDTKGGRVTYEYDAAGRLAVTTGATGLKLRYQYDSLGRRILSNDPDLGIWRYRYDAFGQLVEQTDSKNQITTFSYDGIGRIKQRSMPDSTVRWEYDDGTGGRGKMTRVYEEHKFEKAMHYDQFGRTIGETVTLRGEQYQTRIGLDDYGRIQTTTYPTIGGQQGLTVKNHYDSSGFLYRITDATGAVPYLEILTADAEGHALTERYGNGVVTSRSFNAKTGRAEAIRTGNSAGSSDILNLQLTYDSAGNLLGRKELARGINERFAYDELNRLIQRTNTDRSIDRYSFDAAGRLIFKSDIGTLAYADQTPGGAWAPAHAVVSSTLAGANMDFQYDANGNRSEDNRRRYTYSSDNRLTKVSLRAKPDVSVTFEYDPFGDRYLETYTEKGVMAETVTVGLFQRISEFATSATTPQKLQQNRYRYQVAGPNGVFLTIETVVKTGAGPAILAKHLWYLHKDQLGSVMSITNLQGQVAARFWYDPWGKPSSTFYAAGSALVGAWQRTYASHALYEGLGLIHMNGRVYDYQVGQFLTPDPFGEGVGDTQGLNRFAYVRANPLRSVDTTGYGLIGDIGNGLKKLGQGISNGLRHLGGEIGKWWNDNWRQVVIVAAAVITVASFGTSCVATCAIMAGMAAGAVAGGTAAALYGGSFEDILTGALTGAVIGGVTAGFSYGIGETWASGTAGNIAAHGTLGGVTEAARGGEFGRGFFVGSAGALGDAYLPEVGEVGSAANIARSAAVGGTVSVLAGGSFSNGGILAAFAYAFNSALHKPKMDVLDAYNQYLDGSGRAVSYNISEIEAVDPRSFVKGSDGKLTQIGLSLSAGDGDYYINTKIPYATKTQPNRYVMGSMTLHVKGSLHVSQGQYYFVGTMGVARDTYNMNSSTHRSWRGEAMTTMGRIGGGLLGSDPYKIEINGSRPVGASGYIGP
ncbi:MAG TPA: lipid II-degrading bacteriocin [Telluria sp.]